MDKKLRILMQNENLSASKLADILEIKPAAVSHILSGRNKPSFELICKIVNRFPHINPYWLLGDSQDILNSNAQIPTSQNFTENEATLFDDAEKKVENPEMTTVSEPTTLPSLSRSDIEKIFIVYRDQTFEELRPKKI
jgi:transcriptional regulator with XRE-family HTH domain